MHVTCEKIPSTTTLLTGVHKQKSGYIVSSLYDFPPVESRYSDQSLHSADEEMAALRMVNGMFVTIYSCMISLLMQEKKSIYTWSLSSTCTTSSSSISWHLIFIKLTFSCNCLFADLGLKGSCLGPQLFLLYINDMPLSLKYSKVTIYVDDTSLAYTYSSTKYYNITKCVSREFLVRIDFLNHGSWSSLIWYDLIWPCSVCNNSDKLTLNVVKASKRLLLSMSSSCSASCSLDFLLISHFEV